MKPVGLTLVMGKDLASLVLTGSKFCRAVLWEPSWLLTSGCPQHFRNIVIQSKYVFIPQLKKFPLLG
jgi:hypothetical protein